MGDVQELVRFVEENQEQFYRIAYTYVKSREDALDIVHTAIVKAMQSYHTLRKPEYARTWFYRILINESISFLRKNKYILSLEDIPASLPAENPEDVYKDEYIDLYAAIEKLSPEMKMIVLLRYFEGMKLDEIAEITSTNVNTVKTRLYRALKHLRLSMEVLEHDR
jgi:RNA polymerase sigma-70 factor (ECF subfamily)